MRGRTGVYRVLQRCRLTAIVALGTLVPSTASLEEKNMAAPKKVTNKDLSPKKGGAVKGGATRLK